MLKLVLKDDITGVSVIFDKDITLELRYISDTTTSEELSCKH